MPPSSSSAGVTRNCCAWTGDEHGTSRAATTASYAGHHPADSARLSPGSRSSERRGPNTSSSRRPGPGGSTTTRGSGGISTAITSVRSRIPRAASSSTCGSAPVSDPTIVCTLGMHRSGTSLVSRVLNVLGVYLGPEEHLMRPSSDNPTGHWESRPIKEINDEILSILGGSWQEPPPLPAGWERSPELAAPRHRAREIIQGDFSGSELWGFKDPRTSLTLPFWQRILDPMRYVICLRNPLDVAASAGAPQSGRRLGAVRAGRRALAHLRASRARGHRRAPPAPHLLRGPDDRSRAGRSRAGADSSGSTAPAMPSLTSARRSASPSPAASGTTEPAVPNVVDTSRLPFHVKAYYVALRQFVKGVGDRRAGDAGSPGRLCGRRRRPAGPARCRGRGAQRSSRAGADTQAAGDRPRAAGRRARRRTAAGLGGAR